MRQSRKHQTNDPRDEKKGILEVFNFITRLRPAKGTIGIEITDYCIKLVHVIITNKQEYIIQSFLIEKLPNQTVVDGRIKDPSRLIQVIKSMIAKLDIKTKKSSYHFA